ncbi:ketosteroid isomerase-like protein [Ochrobactrum daejeonense]|uniref:Ketosteroid isomerase-like protein n=1 Tax=Brucella daejeonensis TaxID=659015 RepID=A0A7W9EK03_9HYPH|nr:nuclear transport factor 2 family protein [Brucella daejeonensis]MBB5700767.1 ketosteroid isomerase-like protein [Brucella daejeonensis]
MAEVAKRPEDLPRLLVERLVTGDVDRIAALYEENAVMSLPDGNVAVGKNAIGEAFRSFLAAQPKIERGTQAQVLRSGELAITSARLRDGTVTVEVARHQTDGSWLWVIDHPALCPGVS